MTEHGDALPLECRVEFRDDTARVRPIGEFDLSTAGLVEECLDDVREAGIGRIVLDLGETSIVDSAGLHVMLAWHERARREGFTFALTPGASPVRLAIDAAGIRAQLTFVATEIKDRTRAAYYPGAGPIWVKLVCEPSTGRLLGGQIVGVEGAAKRIDVLATAIWTELTVGALELLDLSYAPPFSGVYDPLLIAARAVAKLL